ncbi:hypothetical protein CTA1_10369 [Colletotrichum tanaceti]|uniref:Secondary metabolism regulator LAE1 n=1 Tax=Colletotrichum tanaceti TaxID=1306861 RepID=A0A4U6XUX6_9PEZI|nr:hypothetical protein CTA1_10369 [Colletotrichum tanaceti]
MADSAPKSPTPALAPRSGTASPTREASVGPSTAPSTRPDAPESGPSAPETGSSSPPAGPAALEVDDTASLSETTSNIDDRISTYTASLSSSVVDYPTEYGRRYHAYRAGSYLVPNDEREMDRLDLNHMLVMKTIGRRLFLAPVPQETTHRILDIGTGTGIWAIEAADVFPNAQILGNDLSAIQPAWIPPNVKFEIDDVESRWVNDNKFDFIFTRYMSGSITDWPKLVRNIYNNVEPGGWVEFQDYDVTLYSDDGTLTEDHQTSKWVKLLIEAVRMIGRDPSPGPKLEGWVKDAGFVGVFHEQFKQPIGPWPKHPHYRDIGMTNLIQVLDGLEAFSLKTICGIHGWTKEEVLVLLAHVRQELKSAAFHAYSVIHVVYAQRPYEEEGEDGEKGEDGEEGGQD